VSLFVETVSPKQTYVGVSLMITFAVQAFESIRAQFTLFGFKTREVGLEVSFSTLGKMPVISVILALGDIWVYICFLYSCNVVSDIEISVDKVIGFYTTLDIPYIYPDDYHIRFQQCFDNS